MSITRTERNIADYVNQIADLTFEISDLRAQIEHLEHEADTDVLTGISNRRAFLKAPVLPKGYAILLLDLDNFKAMNDTNGHAAGDVVLQDFAEILDGQQGFAFRLGGDEFALVTRVSMIPAIGRNIRGWSRTIAGVRVTASQGILAALAGNIDLNEALKKADALLYADKETKVSRNSRRRNRG